MPAHVKASLMGPSVTLPITGGRLNLGTWQVCVCVCVPVSACVVYLPLYLTVSVPATVRQGVWLCEHRNAGGPRRLVVTLQGE